MKCLRNVGTRKVLKTKSAFSTLNEFYDWLKEVKGDTDGVIFLFHDHKWTNLPYFLKKTMRGFKLESKFDELIKGYINCAKVIREREEMEFGGLDEKEKAKKIRDSVSLGALLRKESVLEGKKNSMLVELQTAKRRSELTKQLCSKMLSCCNDEVTLAELKAALCY